MAGFRERQHTADWALDVWGSTPEAMILQAARGMYALLEVKSEPVDTIPRILETLGDDIEELLVLFLNELLYILEEENLVFNDIQLTIDQGKLIANLAGAGRLVEMKKEIKAVTYHGLVVNRADNGEYQATIVFDV